MTARCITVAVLAVGLTSCGGTYSPPSGSMAISIESNPQLVEMWKEAQQTVATMQIEINAALVDEDRAVPDLLPPDPRALQVGYQGITVSTVPDPTEGVIDCPSNSSAQYCRSFVEGDSIYVAASLLYDSAATGWEMQNVILSKLGYNTSGR